MRRSRAPSNWPESFFAARSWAGCTTNMFGFDLRQAQALDAFKEHIPDESRWPELGEKTIDAARRVYVATYPTMLNIVRDETSPLSPHFFDLIVIDESHRSIYNTYGEVLNYFNAIKLGLT